MTLKTIIDWVLNTNIFALLGWAAVGVVGLVFVLAILISIAEFPKSL